MGQGQQELAVEKLRECARSGDWLCLQNLHLVIAWLSQLTQEMSSCMNEQCHKDFRLWLTADPHQGLPAVLLSSAVKVRVNSFSLLLLFPL